MSFGSGIGIGGLASGLDTNTLIQKLVQLESFPIQVLQTKKTDVQSKLTAVGKLKSLVTDLQTKAKAMADQSAFLVFTVNASETGVASFTATGSATAANHTLTVNQLAAVDRWAFDGVVSSTTNLTSTAGQQVAFTVNGTTYNVAVDPTSSSLENIASAINTQAGDDVGATVVNTGTSATPSYKLVLTSKTSGVDARISAITSNVTGLTIDGTGPDGQGVAQSQNNISVGSNAVAVVDGLTVERSTNDFTDVIAGVSFTAESADPQKQINFSTEPDKFAIKKKVQDLVDSYNAVIAFINQQNTYTKDNGQGGPLFGDSLLSSVRSSIHNALFNVPITTVQNDTLGYSTLGLVGISTQSDGTLSVDATKLDDKISTNLTAFSDLFVDRDGFDNGGAAPGTPEYFQDTTTDSGLAATLNRAIDQMMHLVPGANGTATKGLFDARDDSINKMVKSIDDEIAQKQTFVDKFQADLIAKFANLERVMGGLNSQGGALQAALNGLNGFTNQN